MVLEKHTNVTWFTPLTAITTKASASLRLNNDSLLNTPYESEPSNGISKSVIDLSKDLHCPSQQNQSLTVYGPVFNANNTRAGHTIAMWPVSESTATSNSQQELAYPDDSILVPVKKRCGSYACKPEDENSLLCDESNGSNDYEYGHYNVYSMYSATNIPLELLNSIFLNLLYVPSDNLKRLAEERDRARVMAGKRSYCHTGLMSLSHHLQPYLMDIDWPHNDYIAAKYTRQVLNEQYPHQYHSCQCYSPHQNENRLYSCTFYDHYHQQQLTSNQSPFWPAPSTSGKVDLHDHANQGFEYGDEDSEEYEDSETHSGDGASQSRSQDKEPTLNNMMSDLTVEHQNSVAGWETDHSEDSDSLGYSSSESQNTRFELQRISSTSSYSNESEPEDSSRTPSEGGNTTDTESFLSDSSTTIASPCSSSSNAETITQTYYSRRIHDSSFIGSAFCTNLPFLSVPHRRGINRVDDDLGQEEMIYQLHRDQYFHPTTHTSLRSDLYICSLVNRQWRIAALQLLWQSIVLDSESCRIEPSDPCFCCGTFEQSRAARTRLEAMLDSYLEVYSLDLAKCVQTVELDLRVLIGGSQVGIIARILKRLSPFTHLRLIWTDIEPPEDVARKFAGTMTSLSPQIRHVHFSVGFVISKVWTRELDKMLKLTTITLEDLGSMDSIEHDWSRIERLRMNAVIPCNIFGYPATPALDPAHLTYHIATNAISGQAWELNENQVAFADGHTSSSVAQPIGHPQLTESAVLSSGWWRWSSLRKIEIQMQDTILPREWLQDLTAVIAKNSAVLRKRPQQIVASGFDAFTIDSQIVADPQMAATTSFTSLGPPLEVLNIDCEVSHPHKDIFFDLIHAWGDQLKEFHFTKSAELTDDFFLLCLQNMIRVKKLSLRESRGITGEGFNPISSCCSPDGRGSNSLYTIICDDKNSNTISGRVPLLEPTMGMNQAYLHNSMHKPTKTFQWRRDFLELNLDQSRVRSDFLDMLKLHCPCARYTVREVRHYL